MVAEALGHLRQRLAQGDLVTDLQRGLLPRVSVVVCCIVSVLY
jgi:hypothetical protein